MEGTDIQACRSKWIKDPPFPERARKVHHQLLGKIKVVSELACQGKWIIDPPFLERARKGQKHGRN